MSFIEYFQKNQYDKHYFTNLFYRTKPYSQRDYKRVALINNYKKKGNLLEIGCAEGYLLNLLSKNFSVTGVEPSVYAGNIAKDVVENGNLIKSGIDDIDLDQNTYDVVVAFNILEHLDTPKETLTKLLRSMSEGGILVGSVPNNQYLVGSLVTAISNIVDKSHVNTLKVREWRKIFTKYGYKKVDEIGEIVMGRGRSYYQQNLIWPFYSQNYMFIYKKGS